MTAVKDPLYREIMKRLSERLDPTLFERCAVELLRPVYPGLVPVSGGDDAGMDGAISQPTGGPPVVLVCTTARDVIGNLTESLESYVRSGQKSREAVLATSQALTPRQRRNLESRAQEKGFELRNVHDRDDFTGRLYREPMWRKELLGLAGDLPALSAYPRLHRPCLRHGADRTLVGREEAASWVRSQRDDFVLVGQPGVGKRSLLRLLVEDGRGLFVVTNDMARIADGCRAAQPEFLLLEDAHLLAEDLYSRSDLLSAICRMRQETRASFKIAATSWSGQQVAHAIDPTGHVTTKEIASLSRTDTATIVRSISPKLPEAIVAEIVNQSDCRPGLAATLAEYAGAHRIVDRLVDGRLLLAHLRRSLASRGLTGRDLDVLAGFALAGSAGAALDKVASVLGESDVNTCATLSKVAHTGIIEDRGFLAVGNPALRAALVARTFFRGSASLRVRKHLAAIPDPRSGMKTLIGALGRGAPVSHKPIQWLLTNDATARTDQELWQLYARTGKTAAVEWIIREHPRKLPIIAYWALCVLPETTLPKLLSAISAPPEDDTSAQQEDVPSLADRTVAFIARRPEPEVSAIEEWIREPTHHTVQRRQQLLNVLLASFGGPCRPPKRLRRATAMLVRLIFSLRLRELRPDRTELGSHWLVISALSAHQVRQIHALWKPSTDLLRKAGAADTVRRIAARWAAAAWHRGADLPPETVRELEKLAARMITDIVRWSDRRAGVVLWAYQVADECNVQVPGLPPAPSDLQELFGIRPDEAARDQPANVARLATELASKSVATGVERLLHYHAEAGVTLHSAKALRIVENMVRHIAERAPEPSAWVVALASQRVPAHWMKSFTDAMLAKGHECGEGWRALLKRNEYDDVVVQSAIHQSRVPEGVKAYVLRRLVNCEALLGFVVWRKIPNTWKERILTHENRRIAGVAACEMYREYQDHDPELLTLSTAARTSWRRAIVESDEREVLASVFQRHSDVAKAWFQAPARRLRSTPAGVSTDDMVNEVLDEIRQLESAGDPTLYATAASVLKLDAKLQLVRAMSADTDPRAFVALVGNDPTLYEAFLSRRDLAPMHLAPLTDGVPSPDLAELAVSHGYSPEDIAEQIVTWPELHSVFSHFPEFKTVEEMENPGEEHFPEPPIAARHDAMAEWKRHPNPVVRQIYGLVKEMET